MKSKETTSRPFDPAELERKAALYEKWSKESNIPEWKKIYANRAKRINRVLAFMERAGWNKRSSSAVSTEMPKDHIEVR